MNKRLGLATAVLAVALALVVLVANPAAAQQGIQDIWSAVLMHNTLEVQGATTLDSTLSVGTDLTVGDDLVLTGSVADLTVDGDFEVTAQSVLTLTMNGWLTPTGSLQPIASAGAVSINGGTRIGHSVDYVQLVNIGAQTITISETTGLVSAGNVALAAGDTMTIMWANGGWYQVGASNN